MTARYSRYWSAHRALLAVYRAKRRAEVGPYISKQTDMFVIVPDGYSFIRPDLMAHLEKVVDRLEARIRPLSAKAEKEVEAFLASTATPVPPSADAEQGNTETSKAAE
jgi:hypothetical protein